MQDQDKRITTSQQAGAWVVEFEDRRILDELSISRIGDELSELARQSEQPMLVLDFANVAHLSSSALGMLISLQKRLRERDGQLRLCNIRSEIYEVFVITKLSEVFEIHHSRAEALSSLA